MCRDVLVLLGQREAVLPDPDQLPGPQQPDGGGLHAVHSGQPHAERDGGRQGANTRFKPDLLVNTKLTQSVVFTSRRV